METGLYVGITDTHAMSEMQNDSEFNAPAEEVKRLTNQTLNFEATVTSAIFNRLIQLLKEQRNS